MHACTQALSIRRQALQATAAAWRAGVLAPAAFLEAVLPLTFDTEDAVRARVADELAAALLPVPRDPRYEAECGGLAVDDITF